MAKDLRNEQKQPAANAPRSAAKAGGLEFANLEELEGMAKLKLTSNAYGWVCGRYANSFQQKFAGKAATPYTQRSGDTLPVTSILPSPDAPPSR